MSSSELQNWQDQLQWEQYEIQTATVLLYRNYNLCLAIVFPTLGIGPTDTPNLFTGASEVILSSAVAFGIPELIVQSILILVIIGTVIRHRKTWTWFGKRSLATIIMVSSRLLLNIRSGAKTDCPANLSSMYMYRSSLLFNKDNNPEDIEEQHPDEE
ncbi:hypothetical protein Clacol_009765 [Clathrus columnatus]|uniref:Uncharacterized protein n=1 Tax=Clathrus columnatus TaxID=1419009 RepID=A0AAV5ANW1_9AGAM|nr:hypothetical protein Clacol_009765 [Clathrus columnatus]